MLNPIRVPTPYFGIPDRSGADKLRGYLGPIARDAVHDRNREQHFREVPSHARVLDAQGRASLVFDDRLLSLHQPIGMKLEHAL
jgi:hypothetical protein